MPEAYADKWVSDCGSVTLYQGDCQVVQAELADNAVDLIATDPPYFKVKGEAWDRQWDKPAQFLAWLGSLCDEWQRLLKPNGSLYCFASPRMAARVEVEIGKRFEVLNHIIWNKGGENIERRHAAQIVDKGLARSWLPANERIIFAEHIGSDNIAKGEAGYAAKCDELRGFIFEPIRSYLDDERKRAGVEVRQVAEAFQRKTGSRTVTGMAGHWFGRVQWALPTEENYLWLRATLANLNHHGEYLTRQYEDLRVQYEGLRVQYEGLRRPFDISAASQFNDIWDFPPTRTGTAKHSCEKPVAIMEHIVKASSRAGATVLDSFAGSGTTGVACINTGRKFIGVELDPTYFEIAKRRCIEALAARDSMLIPA